MAEQDFPTHGSSARADGNQRATPLNAADKGCQAEADATTQVPAAQTQVRSSVSQVGWVAPSKKSAAGQHATGGNAAGEYATGATGFTGAGTAQVPPATRTGADAPTVSQQDPNSPQRPKKGGKIAALIGLSLLCGALGGGGILAGMWHFGLINVAGSQNQSTVNITTTEESSGVAQAVAKKAMPSVVSIDVTTSDGAGTGSGVILDTDGNILTNYHVIADAQAIGVTLSDGTNLEATVVGSDESSDLAVIKVDLSGVSVTPIEVGDSGELAVGDWVMSIGSPYGFDQSATTGIVSSLYRSTMLQSSIGTTIYTNLIQTDAAINPGNSGGALVNDKGELIGINSLIESESGSNSGIGFAIPSNYAVKVANTLISGQKVSHPYMGVSVQTVTAENARIAGLSVSSGAYVAAVTEGGPAAQAGIQAGDVVVKVADKDINNYGSLILAVRQHEVGETIDVVVNRNGEEITLQVTLASDESLSTSNSSSQNSLGGNSLNSQQGNSGSSSNGGYNSQNSDSSDTMGSYQSQSGESSTTQSAYGQGIVSSTDGTQMTVVAATQIQSTQEPISA